MKSENFPATEEGNNWTVVVFKCPRMNWIEVLKDFFFHIEKYEGCLIPHYTIRQFDKVNDSLIIELRVLRGKGDEKLVKSIITEFIEDYDHQIDPSHHRWITKGATSQKWTGERCIILNMISKFVLEIINSDTTKEDKEEWTHLFSNMTAMFEVLKVYWSPEIMLVPEKNPYKVLKY